MSCMFGPSYRRGDVCYPNYAGIAKNLDDIQNFAPDPDDILLCSYPKSGTHWAFEMLCLAISPDRSKYTEMPVLNVEVLGVEGIRSIPSPKVIQTHLPYDALPPSMQKHPKIVYVLRNPKDQLVSLYHHYSATLGTEPLSWAEFFDVMLDEERVEYGSWIRNPLQWWSACRQQGTNVLFLFYEHMVQDHEAAVRMLSKFIGAKLTDDDVRRIVEMTSFNRMKQEKQPPEEFRKWFKKDFSIYRNGQIGNWKAYFTEDQDRIFNQRYKEVLRCVDTVPILHYG